MCLLKAIKMKSVLEASIIIICVVYWFHSQYTPTLNIYDLQSADNQPIKIDDQNLAEEIKNIPVVLENIKRVWLVTGPMKKPPSYLPWIYHAFVVFETDGQHFLSIEKNSKGIEMQIGTELLQVRDQFNGEDRPDGIIEVVSENGRGQVKDVVLAIYTHNLLASPYNLFIGNCKHFACDIFKIVTGKDCTVGPFWSHLSHPIPMKLGPRFFVENVGSDEDPVEYHLRDARRWITDLAELGAQVYMIGNIKAVETQTADSVVILAKKDFEHYTWIIQTNSQGYNIKFDKGQTALEGLDQSNRYRLDNIEMGIQGKATFSKLFKQFDKIVSVGARSMKTILNSFFDKISSNDDNMTIKNDERENAIWVHCPAGVAESLVRPFERSLKRVRCLYQAIIRTSLQIASKIIFQQQQAI